MPYISVSARILRWPSRCTCCLGEAHNTLQIVSSRTTGKRVILTQTHWWDVPCCSACLGHASRLALANAAIRAGLTIAAILAVCAFCTGLTTFNAKSPPLAAILVVVAVVGAASLAATLGFLVQARHMKAARELLSRDCCGLGRPVVYAGWQGSVHTFLFRNNYYAELFARANSGKLMR